MFDKTARRHETYRRYHAPPPPARVVAGCLVFAAVVGILFAYDGLVSAMVAGMTVAVYVTVSPMIGRATPMGGGVFGFASFMMALVLAERAYCGDELGIVVFGVATVYFGFLALLFRRPFGRGGVIR